jgi:hypothetical protein
MIGILTGTTGIHLIKETDLQSFMLSILYEERVLIHISLISLLDV